MAGGGKIRVVSWDDTGSPGSQALVTGHALHVRVVNPSGGSGGDVNIAEVGGNPVGATVPVSGTVTVNEPVSVDDDGGSLTVDTDGGALDVVADLLDVVTESDVVPATPTLFPVGVERDDTLASLAEADGDWAHLRVDAFGALWTRSRDMTSFLSGGTANGRPISVGPIATPSLIHTASGTQRIYLWGTNSGNISNQQVVLLFGNTAGSDQIRFDIPPGETRPLIMGVPLANGLIVRAFCTTNANVNIYGYVKGV